MAEYYVCTKNRDEHGGHMNGCMVWWRPGGHGYTYDLNEAGIFTDENLRRNYPPAKGCHYIPKELVDRNTYSPRLAWWSSSERSPALCNLLKLSAVSAPYTHPTEELGSETPHHERPDGAVRAPDQTPSTTVAVQSQKSENPS